MGVGVGLSSSFAHGIPFFTPYNSSAGQSLIRRFKRSEFMREGKMVEVEC